MSAMPWAIPEPLLPWLPLLASLASVVVLLVASQARGLRERAGDVALLAFALVAAVTVAAMDAVPGFLVDRQAAADPFATFFQFALALTAAAVTWLSARSTDRGVPDPRAWAALAASLAGMQGMAAATGFVSLWAGFELTNVACALWMAGQGGDSRRVAAASLLRGALASATLLAGFALLAGITGATDFAGLASRLSLVPSIPGGRAALTAGIVLVVASLASRLALAPWLLWPAGDGARLPLPVLAWLTVGGSLGGLAALGRFLAAAVTGRNDAGAWTSPAGLDWSGPLAVAAVATMLAGAVAVLRESNLRRLFAWLAVSQAGWLAMGLAVAGTKGLEAAMVAGVGNALALVGLAAVLDAATGSAGGSIDAIRGLGRRPGTARAAAAAVVLFVASLAGLPPLTGWTVRSALFGSALEGGPGLLFAGAAAAALVGWLGVARVLAILLDGGGEPGAGTAPDADAMLLAGLLAAAVIALGLAPSGLAAFASRSVVFFGG